MKRLLLNTDEHQLELKLKQIDASSLRLIIDDTEYRVQLSNSHLSQCILHDHKVYDLSLLKQEAQTMHISINGQEVQLELMDPKALEHMRNDQKGLGSRVIKANMPGKVVRLMCQEGDKVQSNDPVLVLEAMKMENEIRSPQDGRIKRLCIAQGDSVVGGQLLVEFDE